MYQDYTCTMWGLVVIIITIMIQHLVAVLAHRNQAKYIPGVLDDKLDHKSFVFRSHRAFNNSTENIIQFVVPAFLWMVMGFDADTLAYYVGTFAGFRILFTLVFYKEATNKNPSLRSVFYMLGWFTNIAMVIHLVMNMM